MAHPAVFSSESPYVPFGPITSRKLYRDAWSDLEDYDKVWLITWNPKPRFYNYDGYKHDGEYQNDYEMQWRTMLDKLISANRCLSRYAFVAEVSDFGKLHMHGFMVVSDKVKFYKSFLPTLRNNGFVKMAKANSHKWKVFKYHVKDLACTAGFIKQSCYVLTHNTHPMVSKDLHLYKALVSHTYDKGIKKLNVMDLLHLDYEDLEYDN